MSTEQNLDHLEALARAATPQDFDSAEGKNQGYIECPTCGGDGEVELTADYCNYDRAPLGVQFYGIGPEHVAAEAFCRAANPSAVLELIALARRAVPPGLSIAHAEVVERLGRTSAENGSLAMENRDLREQLSRRAAPVSAPVFIKPWAERLNAPYLGRHPSGIPYPDQVRCMAAEIADLRAALANQPAPTHDALIEAEDKGSASGYRAGLLGAASVVREVYVNHVFHTGLAGLESRVKQAEQVILEKADQPAPTAAPEQAGELEMFREALLNIRDYRTDVDTTVAASSMRFYAEQALNDWAGASEPSEAAPLANVSQEILEAIRTATDGKLNYAEAEEVFNLAIKSAAPSLPAAHKVQQGACPDLYWEAYAKPAPAAGDELRRFTAWTKSHGGLPLDEVDDSLVTDDGLALPTFKHGRTEIAWRAWHAAIRAHQPAQEQANTASQVHPDSALPSRRLT